MALVLVLIVLLPFPLAPAAQAQVFRWIDRDGTIHLTDNADSVPEQMREAVKVYKSKEPRAEPSTAAEERSQARFATLVAAELKVKGGPKQDPVSALNAYGIYPRAGWTPTGPLVRRVVEEVSFAAENAARSRRLAESPEEAREAVARAAKALGIDLPAPQPTPTPRRARSMARPVVVNPTLVVQTPPPVVLEAPLPLFWSPVFLNGVPFATTRPVSFAPRPSRAERVAHIFETPRAPRLKPFRERVRRNTFGTLAPPRLESMFER